MRTFFALLAVAYAGLGSGCTHLQLQRSTVNQAKTLEDIYQQQVLDNLAKFVQNPGALPHFMFPNQGNVTISDEVGSEGTLGWAKPVFDTGELGIRGSRNKNQAWTADPIRDPHKLALMRCAYLKALASCGIAVPDCSDCEEKIKNFYKGHGHPSESFDKSGCWFRWGTKKDIPKDCSCIPVGHYCGVYVWVPPEGREMLTRLTFTILDFALFEPEEEVLATKTVTLYLDANNSPTSSDKAAKVISAIVAQDADVQSSSMLITGKTATGEPYKSLILPRTKSFDQGRRLNLLQLQNELRTLTPAPR